MENTRAGAHSWANLPPFYGGQPLADGVHLHNVRPAGQHGLGQMGELLRRDEGALKQGGAPAGHQEHHRVLRRQILHQLHGRPGAPEGVLIGDRVPPLIDGAPGDLPPAVAVLGHHHPGLQPVPQQPGGAVGHLPGRLAHGHKKDAARAEGPALQGPAHRLVGQAGRQGLLDDGLRVCMDGHHIRPLEIEIPALFRECRTLIS